MIRKIKEFFAKETVLFVAAGCAIATMFLVPPDIEYLHYIDFRVLCLLLCLMAVVAGLKAIGIFHWLTYQLLQWNTLLTAVGTSQVISNVPAAVVLSGFTDQWRQMLAGVNIGGLGTPIASLASLITMKFYMAWPGAKIVKFLGYFMAANLIGLAVLLAFV